MATCDVCGNDYWMAFEVHTVGGGVHTFDSLECAAHKLAPRCEHCECQILGHGVEVEGHFFCCAHCAREVNAELGAQVKDAVGTHPR
ncbi:MAG TPA: Prokaryotic metallothionein [Pseudonocardiaceae bacterium]|jgi:hypothetical protein|nr:Prokaryotic metallothionein [Pseudonocardiaceae bacterium]